MIPDEKYQDEIKKINIKYWGKLKNLYDEIIDEGSRYLIKKSKIKEKYDEIEDDIESLIENI